MASILKHLRSSTADKRPTASGLADGQIAINTASGTPAMFFKDNAGNIVKIGPAHIGTTAPNVSPAGSAGNSDGELWIDESLTTRGLKYYDGATFLNLTPSGTTTTVGLVELATDAETQTGTDNARAVTPSGLQSKISDSTSTTSSTTIASSTAVKSAYDLANAALPKAGGTLTGELLISPSGSLVFEGSSDDSFETTIAVTNPTADRTITFPNVTGNVVTTGDSGTVTSTMILDDTIVNADINSAAAIAHSKLANITAGSVLLGNASNVPTSTALSGDVTINSSGATAISAGVIVNADINASAAIVDTKLDTIATADKVSLSALNIDGATDIGGALENGDLFIVDDGAGGTNRKAQAFRMAQLTYSGVTGDITVASGGTAAISAGVIVNADVNASAAIAGTKVSPDFGSQTIATTGIVSHALGTQGAPTVTFTGDTNTGIFSPGADQVAISTNSVERLKIGTSEVVFNDAGNDIDFRVEGDTNANLLFVDASTDRVGIGTSSPVRRLHIAVAGGDPQLRLQDTSATESIWTGIDFNGDTNRQAFIGKAGSSDLLIVNDNASGALRFSTNATERLRITSAGLVGVGTSSPGAALDVAPDANRNLQVQGKSGTTYGLEIKNGTANSAGEFHVTAASSGAVVVNRGSTEIARFNSTGLGIGTTNPTAALHIDVATGEPLRFRSQTSGSNYFTHVNHAGGDLAYVGAGGGAALSSGTTSDYAIRANQGSLLFGTNGNNERARIDSSGRLLVGTSSSYGIGSSVEAKFQASDTTSSIHASFTDWSTVDSGGIIVLGKAKGGSAGNYTIVANGNTLGEIRFAGADGTDLQTNGASIRAEVDGTPGANDMPGRLVFSTTADGASSPTERMRIHNTGAVLFAKTAYADLGTAGVQIWGSNEPGATFITRDSATPVYINRLTNDGNLIEFYQATTLEGNINVSGNTVALAGAHLSRWSQLPSGAERTEILRGSVLSNIDEMCEWGDEENEQLNRMKVSDVEGDKNVSGVFQCWDDDDDTYTNDFYCAMTGDFIIRIAEGVTVERGDLLMSAGDGTAKPQDDDIIRSKTIAKVTSTNVSCTYEDGSYCVPCVLMAC